MRQVMAPNMISVTWQVVYSMAINGEIIDYTAAPINIVDARKRQFSDSIPDMELNRVTKS